MLACWWQVETLKRVVESKQRVTAQCTEMLVEVLGEQQAVAERLAWTKEQLRGLSTVTPLPTPEPEPTQSEQNVATMRDESAEETTNSSSNLW